MRIAFVATYQVDVGICEKPQGMRELNSHNP